MKSLLSIVAFLIISVVSFSQSVNFKEKEFNFGKIKQNVPATHVFTFTNNGTKPIVIENAVAQCGCTKPEYPVEPIFKGKSAEIKVTFNAANLGAFTKKVTINVANDPNPIEIFITGEVVANQ
ncbi:MAG: DUF1573 domain-containing protein [Sediminibacterium sp.]|nr:DUF1573 domain-containing protein [Sediminibacterium sp.]